jgi:AhpD family alkylhydroperoxidase
LPTPQIHTAETAPPASQALLQGLKEQVGFVPNLAAVMAESPTLLETFLGFRAAASRGALDPVTRELLAIAVAVETGCGYCVAAHSTFALKNGAAPGVVAETRSGGDPDDPRLRALVRLSRAIVRRQTDVSGVLRDVRSTGVSESEILESLAAVAAPMLASAVALVADPPLDALFQPQSWTRPA